MRYHKKNIKVCQLIPMLLYNHSSAWFLILGLITGLKFRSIDGTRWIFWCYQVEVHTAICLTSYLLTNFKTLIFWTKHTYVWNDNLSIIHLNIQQGLNLKSVTFNKSWSLSRFVIPLYYTSSQWSWSKVYWFHFYPRPVLAFGYCRCLRVCVCLCLSVNHQLVRAVTHQPFKLESPNLDQRC